MPITGQGWEMLITRQVEQEREGYRRTVGRYQVYRDGVALTGRDMKGETAESYGPGANQPAGNGARAAPSKSRRSSSPEPITTMRSSTSVSNSFTSPKRVYTPGVGFQKDIGARRSYMKVSGCFRGGSMRDSENPRKRRPADCRATAV